jgi:hypothetical protein
MLDNTKRSKDLNRQSEQNEGIYELKLYVTGDNAKSQLALDNLKEICSKYLSRKCNIES